MSLQNIINTPSDSGLGDSLKIAFDKVNFNFNNLLDNFSGYTELSYFNDEIIQLQSDINEIGNSLSGYSLVNHTHTINQITNLQNELNNLVKISAYTSDILVINNTLITINDNINDIITILDTKLSDAPFSGITYGRKDGQWVQISGGTSDLSGYIPYTGGTKDLILTGNTISSGKGFEGNYVQFNTVATETSAVGKMYWNDQDGTVDLGLKGGNVTLQIGQEQLVRVVNKSGEDLLESSYQAVRVTGAQGNRLKVDLALATDDLNSAETIGIVTQTIINNQEGFVTTSGLVRKINTTGSIQDETWNDGDILYLSPISSGGLTNKKPIFPQHLVVMGYVVRAHINQGSIYVKVNNGYELEELHNVNVSGITTGNTLMYDGNKWVNINPFDYFDGISVKYDRHINTPTWGGFSHNNVEGVTFVINGPTSRTWADTNLVSRTQRLGLVSTTTGTVLGQMRQIQYHFSRNSGFIVKSGFNMAENATDTGIRFFIGIRNTIGTSANVEPDTLLNIAGFCRPSTSDNLHIIHNDNSGTATTIDLGVNFPANTISTDKYLITIESVSTGIYLEINRVGTPYSYSTIATTDIPASNLGFTFGAYIVDTVGPNVPTGFDWYGTYTQV